MAIKSGQPSVGTSATRLDQTGGGQYLAVLVRNRGSVAVFVGGSDVTTGNGYQIDPGEAISFDVQTDDGGLYGIVASGTAACHTLQRSR